ATSGYGAETREGCELEPRRATGGIGRVWLARDAEIGRDVALKEPRPDRPADLSRFLEEEARVTGRLEHPGVVPVYELVAREGRPPFYVMRFVRGRTLAEAVRAYHRTPAPMAFRELLGAFVAVCNAVAYAHSKGVVHRDLKPANVMLGDFGEVVVLDWGLAKHLDHEPDRGAGAT